MEKKSSGSKKRKSPSNRVADDVSKWTMDQLLNFLEKNDCAGFDGERDEAVALVKEILHGDTEKMTTTKQKVLSPDTIPGSELLPLLLPLHSTPVNQWSHTDVVLLAQKLSKGGCVDGFSSKDNRKGSLMLEDISDGLNLFASRNKDIQELLDPFFVCFIHPLHANFNASVIAYPVGGSPVAVPVVANPLTPWIFQFPANADGKADARQFLGHIQANCAGQRAFVFTSGNLNLY